MPPHEPDGPNKNRPGQINSKKMVWITLKNLPGISFKKFLLYNSQGEKIKESAIKSAWQRLMHRALKGDLKERFTFHDLKAKGVSDFEGDKKLAGGHRSERMAEVYDRKPKTVKPTRRHT